MTSGGHKVNVGPTANQRTVPSVQVLYRSFRLQTLAQTKLLVLTGKKLNFKFSVYMLEYWPLRPPCVHSHENAPRPPPFFASLPFPCIIVKQTEGEGLGMRLG